MDSSDIENMFTYHAPRSDQIPRYATLRAKAKELVELVQASCPESREKSLAITSIQQAVMWANAAIASNE